MKELYLGTLLEKQKENKKIAIKYGDASITYKDWYEKSVGFSRKINETASDASINIALFLPNSIDYAIAYFSILFSDKVVIPIGTETKGLELLSVLKYCEIDLIVTCTKYQENILEYLSEYDYQMKILFLDNEEIFTVNKNLQFIKKSSLHLNGSEDDTAVMLHTSGTTSSPKRVMLSHGNLINNIQSNILSLQLIETDIVLISMPMYFGYCNTAQFLTHTYLGASMVIMDGLFFPKRFFQKVQDEKITNFTGVPSMLLMLLEYKYADKYDISSLRYICFGGGSMPVIQLKSLMTKMKNVGFVQTYGQTEASPRTTALLPKDSLSKIGSVGKPIPFVDVQVVDSFGHTLNSGKIGEIVIHGKNVMKGYYKQGKLTKKKIKNGWLYTGDLGYLDCDGYLYIIGRKDNVIISGGINIYPEEIEEVLLQNPQVKEACVISEKHKYLGEVPVAKIVLNEHANTSIDFKEYCMQRLTDYKIPVRFEIFDKLEKTYNGKIKRY